MICLMIFIIIIGLCIYAMIQNDKDDKLEEQMYNIKVNHICEYIGGVPLFDNNKDNMGKQIYVQIRRKSNTLFLRDICKIRKVDIPIESIINIEVKTKEQIINQQMKPSLGKILAFGVFAIGMNNSEVSKTTDKYLLVEYTNENGSSNVFAVKTEFAEQYIKEIKDIKGEEYSINVKNYI